MTWLRADRELLANPGSAGVQLGGGERTVFQCWKRIGADDRTELDGRYEDEARKGVTLLYSRSWNFQTH